MSGFDVTQQESILTIEKIRALCYFYLLDIYQPNRGDYP